METGTAKGMEAGGASGLASYKHYGCLHSWASRSGSRDLTSLAEEAAQVRAADLKTLLRDLLAKIE